MGLKEIRATYGVPAWRGRRVRFNPRTDHEFIFMDGTITGARHGHIRVRMDGEKYSRLIHPRLRVEYLEP